jgi:glycosyltransferase involved in cell wall biosynthesis
MKILIISTVKGPYSWAGSEELWKLMALEALRRGHSVTACLQDTFAASPEMDDFKKAGGVAVPIKPLSWIQRRLAPRKLYSRYSRLCDFSPDVICLSGPPAEPFRQADLRSFLESSRAPKVYIIQGNDDSFVGGGEERAYLRSFYRQLGATVCVSKDNARVLQRQLATLLDNVTILPNPIRTRMVRPLDWTGRSEGRLRFATVGRYAIWSKGQDITMEALSAPEWRERDWEWNLYGSGPDEDYLRELIAYYNLEGRVNLRGFERDFTKIWADNDVHLLCSRAEGLALALIESMFCGRPSVVTFTGGNHELVRDGLDGFVCMGTNPEMIRATLERVSQQRDQLEEMGANSFVRAKHWVPENLGEQVCDVLTSSRSAPRKEL